MSDVGAARRSVLVVEDHDDLREVIVEALGGSDRLTVVGATGSAAEALELLDTAPAIDIMIVDMSLPDLTGDVLIGRVMATAPRVRCLVLSGHREPVYVRRALDAGARGYVLKGDPREILTALEAVDRGDHYISPAIALQ